MADVKPFRGLRYNLDKVGEVSSVITPPYDIINDGQQQMYYERSPYNLIRLELGKQYPEDNPGNNRYTRAAATMTEWMRDNVLTREKSPAFYLAQHRFSHWGRETSFWGLIATVRLEEFDKGPIRATEITMNAPVQDRLELLRACRVNLSPTMGAFIQKEGDLLSLIPDIDPQKPDMSATDDFGVTYNLWIIRRETTVNELRSFLSDKSIYIADGHHRYTTSLTYQKEQPDLDTSSNDPRNFVMMTLISSNDRGLTMLPTHRLVRGLAPEQIAKLRNELETYFDIRELPASSHETRENFWNWMEVLNQAGNGKTAFGLYGPDTNRFMLLTARDDIALHDMLSPERSLAWRKLDVSTLHGIVLQRILGIDTAEKEKQCLSYSPDEAEVFAKVESGDAQLALFLNPAPISSVMAVADAGDRMPQKSTYFYPKTTAGLVMNPLF